MYRHFLRLCIHMCIYLAGGKLCWGCFISAPQCRPDSSPMRATAPHAGGSCSVAAPGKMQQISQQAWSTSTATWEHEQGAPGALPNKQLCQMTTSAKGGQHFTSAACCPQHHTHRGFQSLSFQQLHHSPSPILVKSSNSNCTFFCGDRSGLPPAFAELWACAATGIHTQHHSISNH